MAAPKPSLQSLGKPRGDEPDLFDDCGQFLMEPPGLIAKAASQLIIGHDPLPHFVRDQNDSAVTRHQSTGQFGFCGGNVALGQYQIAEPQRQTIDQHHIAMRTSHRNRPSQFQRGLHLPPARIHEIMKDSLIGAYGTVGLSLALALRASLLSVLPEQLILPTLLASASFGRWLTVVPKALLPSPPGVTGLASAIVEGTGPRQLGMASLVTVPFVLPLVLVRPGAALMIAPAACVFIWWFRRYLLCHLGGVTGDCLGFAVYAGKLIVLLAATAHLP